MNPFSYPLIFVIYPLAPSFSENIMLEILYDHHATITEGKKKVLVNGSSIIHI